MVLLKQDQIEGPLVRHSPHLDSLLLLFDVDVESLTGRLPSRSAIQVQYQNKIASYCFMGHGTISRLLTLPFQNLLYHTNFGNLHGAHRKKDKLGWARNRLSYFLPILFCCILKLSVLLSLLWRDHSYC